MGNYKRAVITDAGNELLARAAAGETRIQFSKACTSAYVYPGGTDLGKLTELSEVKQTVTVSDVHVIDNLISVRALFGNENVLNEYLIQNVGVYASDGETEILMAVCQAEEPDQMPVYNGVAPSSFIYNVQITVDEARSLTVEVNPAGTATIQDVMDLRQEMKNLHSPKTLNLPASGWSGTAPYTQAAELEGVKEDESLEIGLLLTESGDAAARKAQKKSWSMVDRAITGDGTVTFYCYDKKPASDMTVIAKGVS